MRVLLYGGFGGWLNFGDLIQLYGIRNFYQKKGFETFILLQKASLQSPFHLELLKNSLSENLIFYGEGKFYDVALREISSFQMDIFHLYGGGFFNSFWGKAQLEIIERALNFFKPERYFITGQQVSVDFLPYLKRHLEVYEPEIFGVRDTLSLEHCRASGLPVEFTFDDSSEYLLEVRERCFERRQLSEKASGEKRTLFLHLNFSYYVLESEREIYTFRERHKPLFEVADV